MEELEKGISTLKPGKAIGLDNISTEQIKNFGPVTKKWLLQLYNHCLTTHKLPKIWQKAHVIALLKPGKDPSIPKSYRPISLLSHTYKLFERLLLNRIGPVVDKLLIPEQAGFCPGKSTTSQVLNLTQHIEDGFEVGMVTGIVFVDLSAAYDTVNHRCLLHKILELTKDICLMELIESPSTCSPKAHSAEIQQGYRWHSRLLRYLRSSGCCQQMGPRSLGSIPMRVTSRSRTSGNFITPFSSTE